MDKSIKPKLLFVITQGGPWGGAQKYVFDLAQACQNEFEVAIAVGSPDEWQQLQSSAKAVHLPIYQLTHLIRPISPWSDFMAIRELKKLYTQFKPDIVHLNSSKAGVLGALAAFRATTQVVYTVHGWVFTEPMGRTKRWLYRWLEATSARWKDRLIILSQSDFHLAKKLGISEDKLRIIPHSVNAIINFMPKSEARAKLQEIIEAPIPITDYWIGCVANFYPTKGLDILLRAVAEAKARLPDCRLIIIGDGPQRSELEKLINQLELKDKVYLSGFVPDADKYLKAFDLFVLPSRKEGLPYVLFEALAAGVPIVATNVGGISDLLINGENAKVIAPDNVLALVQALIFAQSNCQPMEMLAQKGAETLKSLEAKEMIEETISLYRSLLPAKFHSQSPARDHQI